MEPPAPHAIVRSPPTMVTLAPHDPKLALRLTLRGEARALRAFFDRGLTQDGWKLHWGADGWSGIATKGDKTMYLLFGAFAQYYELRFAFQALPDGHVGLTIYRVGEGCMGGLWGMHKVAKQFRELTPRIRDGFDAQGMVVRVEGPPP